MELIPVISVFLFVHSDCMLTVSRNCLFFVSLLQPETRVLLYASPGVFSGFISQFSYWLEGFYVDVTSMSDFKQFLVK